MSAAWVWGIGIVLNVVAAGLYVQAVRAERRIKETRERLRLDRREARLGDTLAQDFPRSAP